MPLHGQPDYVRDLIELAGVADGGLDMSMRACARRQARLMQRECFATHLAMR